MAHLTILEIVYIIMLLIVIVSLISEMIVCFRKDKRPWIIILWDIVAMLIILVYSYLVISFGIGNVNDIKLTCNIKGSIIPPIFILIFVIRYVINELSKRQ